VVTCVISGLAGIPGGGDGLKTANQARFLLFGTWEHSEVLEWYVGGVGDLELADA
jgi:hypothetical protein